MSGRPCDTCAGQVVCAAADQPPVVEFSADGVFVKQMALAQAGSIVPQHVHAHDHLTMLVAGAVHVYEHGSFAGTHQAPTGILIKAGVPHIFVSMVDNTLLYCIHNTARTGVVEVVAEHQIVRAT